MPLPPSEELFRKKIALESAITILKEAVDSVRKYSNSKISAMKLLKKVHTTLLTQIDSLYFAPETPEIFEKKVKLIFCCETLHQSIIHMNKVIGKAGVIKYLLDKGKEFNQQWQFLERELSRQRAERQSNIDEHMNKYDKKKLN